jgi:3-dehydroquinate dehydratase-2
LLGRREPHLYGTVTLEQINAALRKVADELGVTLEIFQSNHEGALVDKLQAEMDAVGGCVLNPAGLTQYGVSLHDAIKAMPFPVVEVHLTNLATREPWRTHSIVSPAARGAIMGLGPDGYLAALRYLVALDRRGVI